MLAWIINLDFAASDSSAPVQQEIDRVLTYVVTANRNRQTERALGFKGERVSVKFKLGPWEDDNGAVSTVTWTVKNGQASIGSEALSSSIASAVLTLSEIGHTVIEFKAAGADNTHVQYLNVLTKRHKTYGEDYGMWA